MQFLKSEAAKVWLARSKHFTILTLPFAMAPMCILLLICIGTSGLGSSFFGPILTINTKDFTMSPVVFNTITFDGRSIVPILESNVTVTDLGLADKYEYFLFGYASYEGNAATWHNLGFDYLDKINTNTVTINGTTIKSPQALQMRRGSFEMDLKNSQIFYIASMLSLALFFAIGVAGWLARPQHVFIMHITATIATAMLVVFSVYFTLSATRPAHDLEQLSAFGITTEQGIHIRATVWLQAVNMIMALIICLLMAIGVVPMTPAAKRRRRVAEVESPASEKGAAVHAVGTKGSHSSHSIWKHCAYWQTCSL